VAGEQVAQPLSIQVAAGQCGIGAAPAASVGGLQAQVGKRWDRLGAQQRVGQLQQGIGAAGAACVQLQAEGVELLKELLKGGSRLGHGRAA
jgi:hypothetical protein